MSYTITRVELHSANYVDYVTLHEAMDSQGFRRYYDTNGYRYHLPEAEYIRWNGSAKGDLQLAETAAAQTGKAASIMVSLPSDFEQSGLRKEKLSATG